MKRKSDGYLKIVEWSEEDNCYVGRVPNLMLGGIHGDNELEVYKELCAAVDEWIEIYEKDGDELPPETANKKYSGKFNLRVNPKLHKQLAIAALKEGKSLNRFCVEALSEEVNP